MAKPADLDNLDALLIQRQKINAIIADYVSTTQTTTQPLASSLNFAAGKGLQFDGGDELDAYEAEGSFTPTITTDGVDFDSVTYTGQLGEYTIIGKRLFWEIDMTTSGAVIGSATSGIIIAGFPLPAKTGGANVASSIGFRNGFTTNPDSVFILAGTSTGFLEYYASAGANSTPVLVANMGTGSTSLRMQGSYLID
jgi:hypothetical protein